MSKKILSFLMAGGMAACLTAGLASCKEEAKETENPSVEESTTATTNPEESTTATTNPEESTSIHDHTYSAEWSMDDTYHWHQATCEHSDLVSDKAEHAFDIKIITDEYLAKSATDSSPAEYYYVCSCGKKGTETYEAGSPTEHVFDQKVVSPEYLVSEATHTSPAVYEYSCKCGARGHETFTYGEAVPHAYDQEAFDEKFLVSPATCTEPAVYYYSCTCGEKGTETFTYGEALGHEIGINGQCIHEGCTAGYDYSYLVSDYTNTEFTEIPAHDGYVYIHFPEACRWDHVHVESESLQITDYDVAYGSDPLKSVKSDFSVSNDKLHLMSNAAVYGDVYLRIAVGDAESASFRFSSSVLGQQDHLFACLTNMSLENGKIYKTCAYCNQVKNEGVTPTLIPEEGKIITLNGSAAKPMYALKFNPSSIKYVDIATVSGSMSAYSLGRFENDMFVTDYSGIIQEETYLILDQIYSDVTLKISFSDILDMPSDNKVEGNRAYKVRKPDVTSEGALSDSGVLFFMYDSYNMQEVNTTDSVVGDYIYLRINPADAEMTFSFLPHEHVFDSDGNCTCGSSLYQNISEGYTHLFIGENTLYINGDAGTITLTSNDRTLVLDVYDDDTSELVATGTGTVTFASMDAWYYVTCTNVTEGNMILMTYIEAE